jgi:hypothetical protein
LSLRRDLLSIEMNIRAEMNMFMYVEIILAHPWRMLSSRSLLVEVHYKHKVKVKVKVKVKAKHKSSRHHRARIQGRQ